MFFFWFFGFFFLPCSPATPPNSSPSPLPLLPPPALSPTCPPTTLFSTRFPPPLHPHSLSVLSLRNLSSADAGRQTMRNYTGLIDSLMAYVQNCVAASRCDDKVSVPPRSGPGPQSSSLSGAPRPRSSPGSVRAAPWPPGPDIFLSQAPRGRSALEGGPEGMVW